MDEKLLCQIGLSENQARVYRLLVERKSLRPSQLVKMVHESRANCYAILDKLVDMGLAKRVDVDKKLTYFPESPVVLESILAEQIATTQSKLLATQRALPRMLSAFNANTSKPQVAHYSGAEQLETMYVEQMEQPDTALHFVRSTADVPYFGLEKMETIRYLARSYGKRRYGITPLIAERSHNLAKDAQANLKRAWLPKDAYTAPVEWAVSGDVVHIICFDGDGNGLAIKHPAIAESLRQILTLMSDALKKDPKYRQTFRSKLTQKLDATQLENATQRAALARSRRVSKHRPK